MTCIDHSCRRGYSVKKKKKNNQHIDIRDDLRRCVGP